MGSNPMEGVFEVKKSFFMYNTIFVYILRVPVSMKGSKGHQKSRKQRKQTGFKELAHICVLCSAIASPSLLSSSPVRVNPNDHRTCPVHKADTETYKKAHGSKKRALAGIREAKVEVDRDELSKLVSQGTELAKEIQEIKRNWVPRLDNKNKEKNQNDQNKDKDKNKGKKGGIKKGVNEVDAEENTPSSTTDAP